MCGGRAVMEVGAGVATRFQTLAVKVNHLHLELLSSKNQRSVYRDVQNLLKMTATVSNVQR